MSQSPADYLRVLDRTATPGPLRIAEFKNLSVSQGYEVFAPGTGHDGIVHHAGFFDSEAEAKAYVALRTLLPTLADVVEAAARIQYGRGPVQIARYDALRETEKRLATAIAAVERMK